MGSPIADVIGRDRVMGADRETQPVEPGAPPHGGSDADPPPAFARFIALISRDPGLFAAFDALNALAHEAGRRQALAEAAADALDASARIEAAVTAAASASPATRAAIASRLRAELSAAARQGQRLRLLRRLARIARETASRRLSDRAVARIITAALDARSAVPPQSTGSNAQDRLADMIIILGDVPSDRSIRMQIANDIGQ